MIKTESKEYIDIYDENQNFIKSEEKEKAHKLGLWHTVFGCLIINSKTNEVFFQIKNHKHNNIHDTDFLEITAGGHLKKGEKLFNGIREIEEETGIKTSFENLIFINMRKCDKDNNMIIREFQYYYLLPLDIHLDLLKPQDKEVIGFITLDIDKALSIIKDNKISMGIIKINNEKKYTYIDRSFFDKAFINNGVFQKLLEEAKLFVSKMGDIK